MNDRGMVLITVLWVVVVISFVSLSLAAAVRVEMRAMEQSFDAERAFFMAKSAAEVIFRGLQKPDALKGSPVREEGQGYVIPFTSGEARVQFESKAGLIDINGASDKLLSSLFASLEVQDPVRQQLVDSILDWRDVDDIPLPGGAEINQYGQIMSSERRLPANGPFGSIDELMLVKNMTSEIFFGRIKFDEADRTYGRIRGVRDLVTLGSGSTKVNVNDASVDVLKAIPDVSADLAERIVLERTQKGFSNVEDLVARIPNLQYSEAVEYMTTVSSPPTGLVAVATVIPSGMSRTVRLEFLRERKKQILVVSPLIYKDIEVITFGSWRY